MTRFPATAIPLPVARCADGSDYVLSVTIPKNLSLPDQTSGVYAYTAKNLC